MAICSETGEMCFPSLDYFDQETGEFLEIESELIQVQNLRKTKFNVPKSFFHFNQVSRRQDKCCLNSKETFTLAGKRRVIHLKEVSILHI
jgi:hypothetical protein